MRGEYYSVDIERHGAACVRARELGFLNSYTELWVAVNGPLKVARRVVTRAPRAAEAGAFNVPLKDWRVLLALKEAGYKVYLLLYDEAPNTVREVSLEDVLAGETFVRAGTGGASDYLSFRG